MGLPPLYYSKPRGQCAVILLAALKKCGSISKEEAIHYIADMRWFNLEPADQEPYPSQRWQNPEPRWHTLIAWARKDSALRDLVSNLARNTWALTHAGRSSIDLLHDLCRDGKLPVAPCFLWSLQFKKFMCPDYGPGPDEAKRPAFFYRDLVDLKELQDLIKNL